MNPGDIKNSYRLSDVIGKYIELRQRGRDMWGVCPFHNEKSGSFCVQDDKKIWHCYGCGKTGDILDFVQLIHKCSLPAAAEIITGNKEIQRRSTEALPPMADCYSGLIGIPTEEKDLPQPGKWFKTWNPKPSDSYPNGRFAKYLPQLVHPYRKRDGQIVGCTVRINLPDKKIVPMLRLIQKDKARIWSHFPFDKPRPIYGCNTIVEGAAGVVLIVEGEKCADIGRRILGGTVITWAGGTNAGKFTDWSPLRGRNVLLWPDADEEGMSAMEGKYDLQQKWVEGIKDWAMSNGALKVRSLGWDKSKPKGWDIGDAVEKDKMSRDAVLKWMKDRLAVEGAAV